MKQTTRWRPILATVDHLAGVKTLLTAYVLLCMVGCASRSEAPRPERVQERANAPAADSSVLADLNRALSPLATVQPATPYSDLTPFGAAIGNARVVSLGEATHGSREIFQLKHRLVEYLVREKGFTMLAWEGNWPETEMLNRYIRTGEGNPREGLKGLYVWPLQSEEVLVLVEWMREFNQSPGHHPVLTLAGFDMQRYRVALEATLAAVKNTPEAPAVEAVYSRLRDLDDPWFGPDGLSKPAESFRWADPGLKGIADEADGIVSLLEARKAPATTVQMARIVAQALRCRIGEITRCRDEMMARNLQWLLREAHPAEKIVVWAHNAHVSIGSGWMGDWLREALGSRLYVLGFAIDAGTVRAKRREDGKLTDPIENMLPPAAPGTGTALLTQANVPMFFLDMKKASGALRAWLDGEHLFRAIGGGYGDVQETLWSDKLSRSYDGLIFLRETTASRPL